MKKITAFILIIVILLSSVGCVKNKHNKDTANDSKENNIIDGLKNTTDNNQLNNNNTTNSNSSNNNVNQNFPTPFCTEHKYVNNVCSVCNCSLWSGKVDTSWYSALELEFNISTAEQFAGLVNIVNSGVDFAKSKIYLNNPLDLNNIPITPIGATSKTVFAGTFDGKNNTISNVKITTQSILDELARSNSNIDIYCANAGIFGYSTGEIQNLNLTNLNIDLSPSKNCELYVGGITGKNQGTISNCSTQGNIKILANASTNIGGIIGWSNGGNIVHSNSKINIITSFNRENKKLIDFWNFNIGGIIGIAANNFSMSQCSANGNISFATKEESNEYLLGGLIGYLKAGDTYISNCFSSLSIKGNGNNAGYAGGLIGKNAPAEINNCYSTGNIEITCKYGYAAGLIGESTYANKINKTFTTSNVTIQAEKGNVASIINLEMTSGANISSCYYASEQQLSGTTITKNGTPIPLNDLKAAKFYTNIMMWDPNVWNIVDGQFPTLK